MGNIDVKHLFDGGRDVTDGHALAVQGYDLMVEDTAPCLFLLDESLAVTENIDGDGVSFSLYIYYYRT